MLVEFKVRNFRSFKDEAVLSMVADDEGDHRDDLPENYVETGHPMVPRLLKTACIFGANASGKTSLVAAIETFSSIFKYKLNSNSVKQILDSCVFALKKNEPIYFEMSVFVDDALSQLYSFSYSVVNIDKGWKVFSEKLVKIDQKGAEIVIYNRIWNDLKDEFDLEINDTAIQKEKNAVLSETNKNDSRNIFMLEIAALVRIPNCDQILNFITNYIEVNVLHPNITAIYPEFGINKLSTFIANADTGISELLDKSTIDLQTLPVPPSMSGMQIFGKHVTNENETFYINLQNESHGTRAYIDRLSRSAAKFILGGLIVIDEIETGLHVHLIKHLIQMFQTEKNTKAQLIFTTHQGQLLRSLLFRPDQIWFTEKKNQQSRLYSLSDFDLSEIDNIEAAYYTGKFGATPYIEDVELP